MTSLYQLSAFKSPNCLYLLCHPLGQDNFPVQIQEENWICVLILRKKGKDSTLFEKQNVQTLEHLKHLSLTIQI